MASWHIFNHSIIEVVTGGPDDAIPRGQKIEKCPSVQTSVWWPIPVDLRLNTLVDRQAANGGEVTRSQLLAALVAAASADSEELETLVRSYRKSTAGAVVIGRGDIVPAKRRPGRRPR